MTFNRKEIYWLIGTILFILIFNFTLLGIDCLGDSTIDVNVRDTYFVIAKINFFLFFTFFIFYTIYLIRMLRRLFKNLTANLFFLILNVFAIVIITQIISFVDSFAEVAGKTEYPPLSGGTIEHKGNYFDSLSNFLLFTQVLLIIFQTYIGVKTGLCFKQKNQKPESVNLQTR